MLTEGPISVTFSVAEAVVLFEFLSRSAEHQRSAPSEEPPRFEIVDQAEQRVLWNLEATFESILVEPLDPNWDEFLAEARRLVRES